MNELGWPWKEVHPCWLEHCEVVERERVLASLRQIDLRLTSRTPARAGVFALWDRYDELCRTYSPRERIHLASQTPFEYEWYLKGYKSAAELCVAFGWNDNWVGWLRLQLKGIGNAWEDHRAAEAEKQNAARQKSKKRVSKRENKGRSRKTKAQSKVRAWIEKYAKQRKRRP